MAAIVEGKKILHLTLKRKWFDLIATGKKVSEYREGKQYWQKRLLDKAGVAIEFDEIHFTNGYGPDAPFMRVEFKHLSTWYFSDSTDLMAGPCGEVVRHNDFQIDLGEILEIRNWNGQKKT